MAPSECTIPSHPHRKHVTSICPNLPSCVPPYISVTTPTVLQHLLQFYYKYQYRDTSGLWTNGLAYEALKSIKPFLRYYDNDDSSNPYTFKDISDIRETEFELNEICVNYLRLWQDDSILCQQLLNVDSPSHPAWHYYKTLFAVQIGRAVTTKDWRSGKLEFYYQNQCTNDVTFVITILTSGERLTVTVPGFEIWASSNYLTFYSPRTKG
jgi:hypothetical protein